AKAALDALDRKGTRSIATGDEEDLGQEERQRDLESDRRPNAGGRLEPKPAADLADDPPDDVEPDASTRDLADGGRGRDPGLEAGVEERLRARLGRRPAGGHDGGGRPTNG